jgi:hypothetical protein
MAYNFLPSGRDQPFLLPPDLRDWLPPEHLAWFVLDVVGQLDLAPFYRAHRDDGHGHPPTTPRRCSACSSTRTRSGRAPPGRSGAAAPRTSPSGCWPPTRLPTT